jgi:hypothetical protein
MEYADVLERHKVLYGDFRTDVRVDQGHLRLQLEHEAMGTLLQLRRGAMAAGGDSRAQLELLERSSSTVMVVFRAVLRLRGEAPPNDNVELIQKVATAAGMDPTPFVQVIWHKRGEPQLRSQDVGRTLAGYLTGMQQLVNYLDKYTGRRA